ncbi:putative P-loop containing nucleoside triphosphate hydrolase, leucine-rich repeat domain, L [Lupinus albus]|uniref:Putative P-loop containing nucleoside triphosphate hydrolase, leucine-rich repeat domain, L n=1 Tax=Lupinus albus TaxID=3870 RepID=A0A6A4QFR7_LUPAL|nr:putative P-loop containing nucleoside triphosphate hydrolase, leucine-rich repeat domain, L [Lupinus albus]
MGGIGKTTIAKVVFSRFFPRYDTVCFLENIREESKRLGLTTLRDKLLFDLLKDDNPKLNRIGSTLIARRLSDKKVFIVLDDVDSLDQMDELCSVYKYVGPDSKIIITTRNMHLLSGRVDEIYKADIWSFHDSLELFCLHSFKQRCPQKGYEDLLKTAVDYAGGVPLALKVLGSNLHSRSIEFWDSELKKLKNYPCHNIQNVLQVSFDGLDIPQQKIFLDIAFFFKDEDKDFVERILNASDFYATSGIAVLEEKALITVSKGKRIQMHDLIQEMGLNIVRQGIEDSGKRSRLRDIGEVYDLLENKKGSDAVEGIALDLSRIDDVLNLSADTFNMMTYLRFLKLYIPSGKRSGKVNYPRSLDKISDKLRYLEWHGCHLKHLPSSFCAKMLVEIRMPHSHVTELWQGVQDVMNLKVIDLHECTRLKNLPDLSKASKLKRMYLTGCESLLAVHPSVLSLDTLETLMLERCIKLKNLKSDKRLSSLWNVSINGCTSIREFSISSDSMTNFDLSNTGIENFQSSIRNLQNHTLKYLAISNFRAVLEKQKLHVLFDGLASLTRLDLKDCRKISELPDNISNLSCLYELRLDGSSIEQLPESIKHLQYLKILSINNCTKLRYLPELPPNFRELNAANCSSLVTLSPLMFLGSLCKSHYKYMSFKNCMKLEGDRVIEILLSTRALFHAFVIVCLPGSKVPRQFTYRTRKSSFTISLPPKDGLQGIMLSVVLSYPLEELKKHGAIIWCQCYLDDGTKLGLPSSTLDPNAWNHKAITELNSDHVCIWCDSDHFNSIYEGHGHEVSFKFYVTNDKKEHEVLDICPKECGVHFIFDSQVLYQSQQHREISDEKECNDQHNQQQDFNNNCSCSVNCLSDVLRYLWRRIVGT